jgi:hypothetical protein
MRRVSRYQSVFDLLDIQPPNSAEAAQMVESWELQHNQRLPEAVRQWYLIENSVALQDVEDGWANEVGYLWFDYSNEDDPEPLPGVLDQFARSESPDEPRRIRVMVENQAVCTWFFTAETPREGCDVRIIKRGWPHEDDRGVMFFVERRINSQQSVLGRS